MDEGEESQDFNATRAEIFEAISHPLRIKILVALSEKPMGFAELGRAVGIASGGHLSFHLTKLRYLVKMNRQGFYALTSDGKEALWSVNALQQSTSDAVPSTGRPSIRHRDLTKPILGGIVIAVVVLGLTGVYQEGQFAAQQQQIASQQKLIGIIQAGVPFVNGQNASLVISQKDFNSYRPATTRSGLSGPVQPLFDASGNLWVADWVGVRVLEYKPPFSNGMNASLVIGQKGLHNDRWGNCAG
jgi:DNA-binding transcriptional ArsR family regulator